MKAGTKRLKMNLNQEGGFFDPVVYTEENVPIQCAFLDRLCKGTCAAFLMGLPEKCPEGDNVQVEIFCDRTNGMPIGSIIIPEDMCEYEYEEEKE